jgi:predicted AlkP superfamily pyrophosphatase or phosphodiesterase
MCRGTYFMKQCSHATVVLAFLLSWAAHGQPLDAPSKRPIVILITIDGFPARALDDPRLPMPTLRELTKNGAVAKGMIPINPSVTWPNHTTLITGVDASVHHVMANGLMEFPAGGGGVQVDAGADKSILVHAPTLYDIAAEHGLTTGQVDWVAIAGAHNVLWQFDERPDVNSPIAKDLVTDGIATTKEIERFSDSSPAWRDQIWTDAAIDILKRHTPDLLLLHLLETDSLQHRYAPMTPAAYAAYAYADHCLSRIVAAVREANLQDRVTYLVVSDHGFSSYTHVIRPNALLRTKGVPTRESPKSSVVWVKAEGGHADVFVSKEEGCDKVTAAVQELFRTTPGVEHVYTNEEAQALGLPALGSTSQAPDLWLTAVPGYAFEDGDDGEPLQDVAARGQHGYLNTNAEMQALFVASGVHVRPGSVLPVFKNLQVAPTIAYILGFSLPQSKAPPLLEILR